MSALALAALLLASPPPEAVPVARAAELLLLREGDLAPPFKLRTTEQTLVRLDELAYPGKAKRWAPKRPVLLDFFRTDCGPCRAALPELSAIARANDPRGLKVVLVALLEPEDGRKKLERFLAEARLPFTVVIDETEHFAQQYLGKQVMLPATFLIDREGVVRGVRLGGKGSMKEYFEPAIARALAAEGADP